MEIINRLYQAFEEKARNINVKTVSVGLGYTAAQTEDGGMGIAYTYFDKKTSCAPSANYVDFESRPAIELLGEIKSTDAIRRSMALALINALNYERANAYPEDTKEGAYFTRFGVTKGSRVAMVGHFKPIARKIEAVGAEVEIIDYHKEVGNTETFFEKLGNWPDILILTSTSLLNHSAEDILNRISPDVKTVLMGPSSPLYPEAFQGLPVDLIAGTVPVDFEGVLKAVRHGTGTPVISKRCKKVVAEVNRI